MKTVFPADTGFSGKYIVGMRKNPLSTEAQRVGAFVLKRVYKIVGDALIPEGDLEKLRESDGVIKHTYDTNEEPFIFTQFENDLAVFKPKADFVVTGFYEAGDECDVHITSNGGVAEHWFHREGNAPKLVFGSIEITDLDASTNMFGWQQRQLPERRDYAVDVDNNGPPNAPVFNNLFFNFFRRDFAKSGFPKTHFPRESRVTINRQLSGGSTQTLSFNLGAEKVSAKLFSYNGRSPDKQRYWCCKKITDVRCDTLIITPASNTVYALWRGVWDFDSVATDRYRMLEVNVGS